METRTKDDDSSKVIEAIIEAYRNIRRKEITAAEFHRKILELMDFADGCDFDSLHYFKLLPSLAGINFIGKSVNGLPITKEMLSDLNVPDFSKAYVLHIDLHKIPEDRRTFVQGRFAKHHSFIDADGYLNLVHLVAAAKAGSFEAVQHCLQVCSDTVTIREALRVATDDNVVSLLCTKININECVNGYNELHLAIQAGNAKRVKLLLANHADCNVEGDARSPLMMVVSRVSKDQPQFLGIARLLLEAGADPYYRKKNGNTLIDAVCENGFLPLIKLIIEKLDKSPNWYRPFLEKSHRSPQCFEVLKLLQSYGVKLEWNVDGEDKLLQNVMHKFRGLGAIESGSRSKPDNDLTYLLIYWDAYKSVELILQNREDKSLSFTDKDAILDLLDDTSAILDHVLEHIPNGYARMFDLFMRHGLGIVNANYLLHTAVKANRFDAVRFLVAHGVNVNSKNLEGKTPLHHAVKGMDCVVNPHPYPQMVKLLLELGALPTEKDVNGLTVAEYAESYYKERFSKSLFDPEFPITKEEEESAGKVKEIRALMANADAISAAIKARPLNSFTEELGIFRSECLKEQLNLPEDKLVGELKIIKSMFTSNNGKLFSVPVMLNGRVYDLDELLSLPEDQLFDPVNHQRFVLSQIEPARNVLEKLKVLKKLVCCEEEEEPENLVLCRNASFFQAGRHPDASRDPANRFAH